MPFEINGQYLDLTKDSRQAKFVKEAMAEIRKKYGLNKGKKLQFVYPDALIRSNPLALREPGLPHKKEFKPAHVLIPLVASKVTENGIEQWKYYESKSVDPRSQVATYQPGKLIFSGSRMLADSDIEEIFFWLRLSPFCETGENKSKDPSSQPLIKLYEPAVEMQRVIDSEKHEAMVKHYVYNVMPDDKVITAARAFMIGVEGKEIPLIKKELVGRVITAGDAAIETLKAMVSGEKIEAGQPEDIQITISIAKERGIISLEKFRGRPAWLGLFDPEKGQEHIVTVKPNEDPMRAISEKLINDGDLLEKIKLAIE